MESKLTLLPDLGYENEPVAEIKIAATFLAFKNAEIISLLEQRGNAIKAEKWEKQREIET